MPESVPSSPRGLVAVLSKDLFFVMRIRTSLRQLGYDVTIAQKPVAFTTILTSGDRRASLGLVDFNQPVDWKSLAGALELPIPIIAFGPHKDVEGFRAAKSAGVTRVVANGEFTRALPQLVERYVDSSQQSV